MLYFVSTRLAEIIVANIERCSRVTCDWWVSVKDVCLEFNRHSRLHQSLFKLKYFQHHTNKQVWNQTTSQPSTLKSTWCAANTNDVQDCKKNHRETTRIVATRLPESSVEIRHHFCLWNAPFVCESVLLASIIKPGIKSTPVWFSNGFASCGPMPSHGLKWVKM